MRVPVREIIEGRAGSGRRWECAVELDEAVGEEGMVGERRLDEERVRCAAEAADVAHGDGALDEGEHRGDVDGGGCRGAEAWRRVDGERRRETAHGRSIEQRQLSGRPMPYPSSPVQQYFLGSARHWAGPTIGFVPLIEKNNLWILEAIGK